MRIRNKLTLTTENHEIDVSDSPTMLLNSFVRFVGIVVKCSCLNRSCLAPRNHRCLFPSVNVIASLIFAVGCGSQAAPSVTTSGTSIATSRDLTVAAASDLKFAMEEVIADFERQHPDVHVKVTYGSSGNFFAQLSNKAPFDLFLSADIAYPQKLVELGLADKDTLFSYAIGSLVVWVRKDSPLAVESRGIEVFNDPSIQKIAIANPRHAPYGRAAEAALKKLGVYDQIAERLVLGENVAQTAQFIETGAADIGIISRSLATARSLRENGRFWLVPQSSYPPLEQGGAILSWARDRPAAVQFAGFLVDERCRAILKAHGFAIPDKP